MADVASAAGEESSPFGQSRFAITRGATVERLLFADGAKRLREALVRADVLPEDAQGFRDFRLALSGSGGHVHSLDEARGLTTGLLQEIAGARTSAARRKLPAIVAGATVSVPGGVMIPEAIHSVDVLLVLPADTGAHQIVGEIKAYPDRGGYTDSHELATARAQAGVYVHGLGFAIDQLGLADHLIVHDEGFLVLSRPGSIFPSIRAREDLRFQRERARRGFEQLRAIGSTLAHLDGVEESQRSAAVLAEPTAYGEACVAFCDRAPACHKRALDEADPVALGEDVKRFLGETRLDRVLALMDGAEPVTVAEIDLVRRLRAANGNGAAA
jgi:hypothetical protein